MRGFREELTEEERYRVADDVVHQLKQAARCHCDLGQILRSGFRRRFLCRFNGAALAQRGEKPTDLGQFDCYAH